MDETGLEGTLGSTVSKDRTEPSIHPAIDGYIGRMRQWLIRMLIDQGVLFGEQFGLPEAGAEVEALFPLPDAECDRSEVILSLHRALPSQPAPVSGRLADNLERLRRHLDLGTVEADLLGFLIAYRAIGLFEKIADLAFRKVDLPGFAWRLSVVTGHPPEAIEGALQFDSGLVASGLIRLGSAIGIGRVPSIDLLVEVNHRGMKLLTADDFEFTDLLETAVRRAAPGELTPGDFDFMAGQRDLAVEYLRALRENGLGCAVLFDGPPGTGKTAFARLISAELGFDGYEIKETDNDGDAAAAGERLQFLALAENLVARGKGNGLIIFDEADAVLATDIPAPMQRHRPTRAALIRRLETLRVPTIWITNHGDEIDPALRRRFDLVLRFRTPPPRARFRILDGHLRTALQRDARVRMLCADKATTPARIEQASRVASLIAGDDQDRRGEVFCRVLGENLGLDPSRNPTESTDTGLPYRPDVINASEDLESLTAALAARPQARIALHGPPGTGKTRFVHHLADRCGLQLAEYRASDLLSRYLGDSEKNIRRMFEECRDGRTLLLLDEADSLLRSRQYAQHNFEVNQVNELLKALEGFPGLFVASTNLMDKVDTAVLRRLDLKIRFDWLCPEQRWRLFLDLARTISVTPRGAEAKRLRHQLDRIQCVTPGDFAVLARQIRFRSRVRHAEDLLHRLEQEVAVKPESRHMNRGIGFTATLSGLK